jgi:dsRNA-specific ribonuclease
MKQFTSRILWEGVELGRGTGRSKKDAEVQAARKAIELRSWETAFTLDD